VVIAHNICMKCRAMWHDYPGAFAKHNQCPLCESDYWTWFNYADKVSTNDYCGTCKKSFKIVG